MTYDFAPELRPLVERQRANFRRMIRAAAAISDAVRLAHHAFVTGTGREWEYPEAVLDTDELDAIAARQMGRTLADIDDLPETTT